MISIVTAYYNRKELFRRTLESIKRQNSPHLLEVIAVDDGSKEGERLEDLVAEFPFLKVIRLDPAKKWYHNSCIPFNIGFKAAKGDKIIIQNPECLHYGAVLNTAAEKLTTDNYISFASFALDKDSTDNLTEFLSEPTIVQQKIAENNFLAPNFEGAAGWYNHSTIYPMARHYCCAITKNNLYKMHGFDERFALGMAADDDEFIERIRTFLKVEFVDYPFVFHLNHYSENSTSYQNIANKRKLHVRNLYLEKNRLDFIDTNKVLWNTPDDLKKFVIQTEFKLMVLWRYIFKKNEKLK